MKGLLYALLYIVIAVTLGVWLQGCTSPEEENRRITAEEYLKAKKFCEVKGMKFVSTSDAPEVRYLDMHCKSEEGKLFLITYSQLTAPAPFETYACSQGRAMRTCYDDEAGNRHFFEEGAPIPSR